VPQHGARRRGQLSLGAVVVGLICFFLPCLQVSCGGQRLGQVSRRNLAAGMNMMGVVTVETQPGFLGTVPCGAELALPGLGGRCKQPQQAGGGLRPS
jgi:hypothetical protein